MNQKILIHIHSDTKFLHDSSLFVDKGFNNQIIVIGTGQRPAQLPDEFFFYNRTIQPIQEIIKHVEKSDHIILYKLDELKIELLQLIPPEKKVILRFFGSELYNLKRDKYISERTRRALYPISGEQTPVKILKNLIRQFFPSKERADYKVQKEIYQRLNGIIMVHKSEYDELRENFYMPPFIRVPHTRKINLNVLKKDSIILGNSRHLWNNHLDILSELKSCKNLDKYRLFLFFSYGPNNNYVKKVRQKASYFKNIHLQETFLTYTQFQNEFLESSAVVINSYRQHAGGSIFSGITHGCKIYLNPRNSTSRWLKEKGFLIADVKDLKKDIENNNIRLTPDEMQFNANRYLEMESAYTPKDFVKKIKEILS